MQFFHLTPDRILEKSSPSNLKPQKSLTHSILFASISFGVVSVIAYAIWAFRLIKGQGPMYATIALVYLVLSGWALSRLLIAPKSLIRFTFLFASAFLVYAIFWCLLWFGLKGGYHGDLYGSAIGLFAMTLIFQSAFGQKSGSLNAFCVLFTFHTLGYYLGGELYSLVGGSSGRLLWGAAHGLGFGAGLGNLLHHCQSPLAKRAGKSGSEID